MAGKRIHNRNGDAPAEVPPGLDNVERLQHLATGAI